MSLTVVTQLPPAPARPASGHKGTFGKVLLVAGSPGMTGAAVLAGRAALRGGVGLVYVATPEQCQPIVAAGEPSYLTIPLPQVVEGEIDFDSPVLMGLLLRVREMNAFAIGPGWGRGKVSDHVVLRLYSTAEIPGVVDADALNVLATEPNQVATHSGPRILTPHAGEFARLTGMSIEQIQQDRVTYASEFAARHNVIVVLKGLGTVVTDGQRYYVNTTGNSGLATGGTGDVLTGLITALLGQGMSPFEAAQLGVYLHGLAGDLAAADLSEPGLIASDLPNYLAKAWVQVLDKHS